MIFSKFNLEQFAAYRFRLRRDDAKPWPNSLVCEENIGDATDFLPTDRFSDEDAAEEWREYEQAGSGLIVRLTRVTHAGEIAAAKQAVA